MSRPHPALFDLAAGRGLGNIDDTREFLWSAAEHRMGGLVMSSVMTGEVALEPTALRPLAAADLAVRAQQARLWGALEDIVGRLSKAGFEIATLKGITAQARWYDRPGERPCLDVDLLVAPHDRDRIEEILALLDPCHPLLPHVRRLTGENHLQAIELTVSPSVPVDLHVDPLRIGLATRTQDTIWERAVPFPLANGSTVLVPDPETHLIHFLLHLNRDSFPILLGFADVVHLFTREDLDWPFIERLLRKEGLEDVVFAAFERVTNLLRVSFPQPVAFADPYRHRRAVWKHLWPEMDALQGPDGRAEREWREFWLPFLARGRVLEAIRWWLSRFVVPPAILVTLWDGPGRGPHLWRVAVRHWRQRERLRAARRRDRVVHMRRTLASALMPKAKALSAVQGGRPPCGS